VRRPAALAADWLASAWDQNAGLYVLGPAAAAAVVEEIASAWAADLLGLPPDVSVGFVTGAQLANVTGLAAALLAVLDRAGWDVSSAGLWGAPRVRVLAGEQRHGTVDRVLRFLGVGTAAVEPIPADAQGRMRVDALASAFDEALDDRPAIPGQRAEVAVHGEDRAEHRDAQHDGELTHGRRHPRGRAVLVRRDRAEDGMSDRGEEQPGRRTHEDQRRDERAVGGSRCGPGGEPGRSGRDQRHAEDHRRSRPEPIGQRAAHRCEQDRHGGHRQQAQAGVGRCSAEPGAVVTASRSSAKGNQAQAVTAKVRAKRGDVGMPRDGRHAAGGR
jgi:hypothetical protein